jgi:hypothetical protein
MSSGLLKAHARVATILAEVDVADARIVLESLLETIDAAELRATKPDLSREQARERMRELRANRRANTEANRPRTGSEHRGEQPANSERTACEQPANTSRAVLGSVSLSGSGSENQNLNIITNSQISDSDARGREAANAPANGGANTTANAPANYVATPAPVTHSGLPANAGLCIPAFEGVISKARRAPWGMPMKERESLWEGIRVHAVDSKGRFEGNDLLRWVQDTAEQFVDYVAKRPSDQRRFWPLTTASWLRYLNEVPVVEAEPVPPPADSGVRKVPAAALAALGAGIGVGGSR